MTRPKVYGRKATDPERLRLLEAVAEAARAEIGEQLDLMGTRAILGRREHLSCAEYLAKYGKWTSDSERALLEALAALEALDEKEQP